MVFSVVDITVTSGPGGAGTAVLPVGDTISQVRRSLNLCSSHRSTALRVSLVWMDLFIDKTSGGVHTNIRKTEQCPAGRQGSQFFSKDCSLDTDLNTSQAGSCQLIVFTQCTLKKKNFTWGLEFWQIPTGRTKLRYSQEMIS